MAFEGLSEKLNATFKHLRGKGRLSEEDIKLAMREVRLALLEADVSYKVVKDFVKTVSERAVGVEVLDSLTPAQQVIKIVSEELTALMGGANAKLTFASKPPTVVMMVGLQGAGKTTNVAKLAGYFRKQGRRPLLTACDVYRPAAITQLQVVGKQLGIPVFEMGQIDPVQIAQEAVKYAGDHGNDIVFLDTAGRLHIDEALMDELKRIKAAVKPTEILLVVDAMTGQDAVNAATAFDEALGIDGVVLTKLDGDARGGAALSIRAATGKPIKFIGTGEKLDMIEPFHPDRMAQRILGMGDVLSFIERAEQSIDQEKAKKLEEKLKRAEKAEKDTEKTEKGGPKLLRTSVGAEEIAEVVSRATGIPVSKMMEGERQKLLHMADALEKRVIGQDEAVKRVTETILRSRAGLSDPNRPYGSFLFLGPTGVGKTELTKALAEFLFDTDEAMIRIDMSEFMEKHSVARLIGAPPGYVGYEEGGYLTEAVRRKPYSVILLDEVEKAHPDVFNVLLQVLDDGRMTDGQGRTVDFKNCVIVMTSNLGSAEIQEMQGEPQDKIKSAVMQEVRAHFRPEFVNRIDEIVVFNSLDAANVRKIAEIQLEQLRKRMTAQQIGLDVTEPALDEIAKVGFDPQFGARPLRRAIQDRIENGIARLLLEGKAAPGDTVKVGTAGEDFTFDVEKAKAEQSA